MKKIFFRDGNFTVVDDDFNVSEGSICKTSHGYAIWKTCLGRRPGKKSYIYREIYLHRLIMGNPSGLEVDHINGNKLDNRKENLRVCSRSENARNSHKKCKKSSKFKGVHRSICGNWIAQLKIHRKCIHIGTFKSEIDAALAYDAKAKEIHGEFAWLNFSSSRT